MNADIGVGKWVREGAKVLGLEVQSSGLVKKRFLLLFSRSPEYKVCGFQWVRNY
jgi:hypothetical protein